jgi:hypothetical protein
MTTDDKLTDYIVEQVVRLVKTPSLAGHTDAAVGYIENELDRAGIGYKRTGRGALLATLEGRAPSDGERGDQPGSQRALTAHIDTLGAMVKELGKDGSLLFTAVGGYALATVEGEYVTVETGTGRLLRGTILFDEPSAHVSKKVTDTKREFENMRIRLDSEEREAGRQTRHRGRRLRPFRPALRGYRNRVHQDPPPRRQGGRCLPARRAQGAGRVRRATAPDHALPFQHVGGSRVRRLGRHPAGGRRVDCR